MKRMLISLLLAACLALPLTACSASEQKKSPTEISSEEAAGTETASYIEETVDADTDTDSDAEDTADTKNDPDVEDTADTKNDPDVEDTADTKNDPDVEDTATVQEGTGIRFETTDLDGNPVKSEDIFSKNKITMVNIWGTFCGPCINEMPDLEVLNGRLADMECDIIGIVCDVTGSEDTEHIESAKEIINATGVTYVNLLPWETFFYDLPAQFIPTTYFIDSDGNVIGEAAVGARGADDYEALLKEALEKANN